MDDVTLLREFRRFRIREKRDRMGARPAGGRGYGPILRCLVPGEGRTQREIAELAEVRAQTLSEALAGMEERGLIQRVVDERDRRAIRVFLTEKGVEFRKAREEEFRRRAAEIFAPLSEAEKETLYELLCKLHASREEQGVE